MAPELLDGAANLRESEASLKQIDVYSLGLVLWELATRCQDMYHGEEIKNVLSIVNNWKVFAPILFCPISPSSRSGEFKLG